MKTERQRLRRLKAHSALMAHIHKRKQAHQVYACRETASYHQSELVNGRSTIADNGLIAAHDSLVGIVDNNAKRRIEARYNSMLPLGRVRASKRHAANINAAVALVNLNLISAEDRRYEAGQWVVTHSMHDLIERALQRPTSDWRLLVWRVAYYDQRAKWLKSDSATATALRGKQDAIDGLKRINGRSDYATSVARSFD